MSLYMTSSKWDSVLSFSLTLFLLFHLLGLKKMLSLIIKSLGEIVLFLLTPRTQESQTIILLRITQSLGSLLTSNPKSAFTKHGAFAACTADYR